MKIDLSTGELRRCLALARCNADSASEARADLRAALRAALPARDLRDALARSSRELGAVDAAAAASRRAALLLSMEGGAS